MLKIALERVTLTLIALAIAAPASATYITDELRAEMRSGASNGHRIINFLPAGTDVEVLEEDDTFSRVRTSRGTEGWVPTEYLSPIPSAADRLVAAEAKITRLEDLAKSGDRKSFDLMNQLEEMTSRAERLDAELTAAQSELSEIRQVSANAIETYEKQQRLSEQNDRLRNELEDLAAERERLAENLQRQWLLMGAGLIFIGLVLGTIIKSRPRKSAWS